MFDKKSCLVCEKDLGRFTSLRGSAAAGNPKKIWECISEGLDTTLFLPDDYTSDDLLCAYCTGKWTGMTKKRIEKYKEKWNAGGVIQFKNERIAILHRSAKFELQFVVAFDDLTKEGYRCVAQDEGMQAEMGLPGISLSGGLNSYYFFQKIECVSCGVNTDSARA